jgi:hypothetical protein
MKRTSLHNHSTHTRDAALQRLRSINRWVIMGSIVLTGVFADVAANAFPGHKKTAAATTRHKAKSAPTGVLAPPEQAPERAPEASSGEGQSDPPSEGSAGESSASSEAQAPETSRAPEASEEPSSTESAPSESSEPVVSGGS